MIEIEINEKKVQVKRVGKVKAKHQDAYLLTVARIGKSPDNPQPELLEKLVELQNKIPTKYTNITKDQLGEITVEERNKLINKLLMATSEDIDELKNSKR